MAALTFLVLPTANAVALWVGGMFVYYRWGPQGEVRRKAGRGSRGGGCGQREAIGVALARGDPAPGAVHATQPSAARPQL